MYNVVTHRIASDRCVVDHLISRLHTEKAGGLH